MRDDQVIEERKRQFLTLVKEKFHYFAYILLAFIVFLAVWIRTRNIPGLKDITTNDWTLGPDLDPFLFLRWAKDIVANGHLYAVDMMRYVPLGYNTNEEVLLHPYAIAWFHDFLSMFGFSDSVTYSAIIYPVFLFALTVIVFFLFVKEVFTDSFGKTKASIIALIASLFLSVLPSILPRTIAGIPEKESSGFFFLFLAFYLFLAAWKAKSNIVRYTFAVLSGLATAGMAFVWGGYIYIIVTISIALLISFVLGQINKNKIIISLLWVIPAYLVITIFSDKYNLLGSTTTLIPIFLIATFIFHLVFDYFVKKHAIKSKYLEFFPSTVNSLIIIGILGVIALMLLGGTASIIDKFQDATKPFIQPITSRFGQTVAENKQPYFAEWADSYGPQIFSGVPLLFWLFFIGSIGLYLFMLRKFDARQRIVMTIGYTFFLFAIIFSRYSSASVLNGVNTTSIILYLLGVLALVVSFAYYFNKHHKSGDFSTFESIDFGLILVFSFFFFSIVSARGAVRTIMLLDPSASILVAFFVVYLYLVYTKFKKTDKMIYALIALIILIAASLYCAYYNFDVSKQTAESYAPGVYNQQWQMAMSWVRENTPESAVFAHWWDYGYWLQSIGDRATVLDGGNAIGYWNYLMGRYALTGTSNTDSLEFLYSHNATHFLIDSSDIGKYGAFSTIGSDANFDRQSYIPSFISDPRQSQDKKNSTILFFSGGGFTLDQDIIYDLNGTRIFLPAGKAGLGAVLAEFDKQGNLIGQAQGVYVYQSSQYVLPLKYSYYKNKFTVSDIGIDAGVYIYPVVAQATQGVQVQKNGALLYLSNKTVNSQLARLYLYDEDNQYFKLAHSEDDFLVSQLKAQNATDSDIVYDGLYGRGLVGPIKIWDINYPAGMHINPLYLQKAYPTDVIP